MNDYENPEKLVGNIVKISKIEQNNGFQCQACNCQNCLSFGIVVDFVNYKFVGVEFDNRFYTIKFDVLMNCTNAIFSAYTYEIETIICENEI